MTETRMDAVVVPDIGLQETNRRRDILKSMLPEARWFLANTEKLSVYGPEGFYEPRALVGLPNDPRGKAFEVEVEHAGEGRVGVRMWETKKDWADEGGHYWDRSKVEGGFVQVVGSEDGFEIQRGVFYYDKKTGKVVAIPEATLALEAVSPANMDLLEAAKRAIESSLLTLSAQLRTTNESIDAIEGLRRIDNLAKRIGLDVARPMVADLANWETDKDKASLVADLGALVEDSRVARNNVNRTVKWLAGVGTVVVTAVAHSIDPSGLSVAIGLFWGGIASLAVVGAGVVVHSESYRTEGDKRAVSKFRKEKFEEAL